jgi:hypothetical protein
MGHVDVDEMLASVPSSLLVEWKAYEYVAGPLNDSYLAEVLALNNEALQQIAILTAQDKKAKVQHIPRPNELYEQGSQQQDAGENEDVVRQIDKMIEGDF